MNVQFSYLYRDAGNYKVFGSIVFSNPDKLDLIFIEQTLRGKFIDTMFFDPAHFQIPRLQHPCLTYDPELDHNWNEFESLHETTDPITDTRTINVILELAERI